MRYQTDQFDDKKDYAMKLLIPGPVQPEQEVLQAMSDPVQPHYGPEWTQVYNETVDMLKTVYGTTGDVFIIVGSGSSGLDAAIGSMVPTGEKIIVGVNGFFGERLCAIAQSYGLEVIPVSGEWGQILEPDDVSKIARQHTDASALAIVHLETSTTIVNPIKDIGKIANELDIPYIVDAVSSLGGLPMHMDEWGIDVCVSASQKCLGAPPGLATVAVGPGAWTVIDRVPEKSHGWYLDLRVWKHYQQTWADWHPFPITMATNNVMALRKSLEGLLAEGIEERMARYRKLAVHLREGLRRIGMRPFTPDDLLAPVLTAAYGPPGIPTGEIVAYMSTIHDTKIAGGLGEKLKDVIFRIGHMAPATSIGDIDDLLKNLTDFTPDWRSTFTEKAEKD